jgi:hypothetical protein
VRWITRGLPDMACHVIGCRLSYETRHQSALNDVVGNVCQAPPPASAPSPLSATQALAYGPTLVTFSDQLEFLGTSYCNNLIDGMRFQQALKPGAYDLGSTGSNLG